MPLRELIALTLGAASSAPRGDLGAGQFRMIGIPDRQRHARLAHRIDAARMQHLGAGRGDFLRFLVVQPRQQARARHLARIGAEHAGDVGPDFHFFRIQQRAEIARRRVRTAATEDHGFAGFVARHEALRDEQVAARGQRCGQRRIRRGRHRRRKIAAPGVLVRQRLREQMFARIEPVRRHAARAQIRHAERARHQFAERQHFGLPRQRARVGARDSRPTHRAVRASSGSARDRSSRVRRTSRDGARRSRRAPRRARRIGAPRSIALSLSVMPDSADTTISTRLPRSRQRCAIAAILSQRSRVDTLVPPNFSTIQAAASAWRGWCARE